MIKVFWLEPIELVQVQLRRFTFTRDKTCRGSKDWGHDASHVIFEQAPRSAWVEDLPDGCHRDRDDLVSHEDPRWPETCEKCGEPFQIDDEWQLNTHQLHRGASDGKLYTLRNCPVGSMWNAAWLADRAGGAYTGPDGISLHVRTPGGDWNVDGEASNCTRKQDQAVPGQPGVRRFGRSHYCWVRHGDPRTGEIHVDKNGNTCAAGAGSIICGNYHGFLHNGHLTPA